MKHVFFSDYLSLNPDPFYWLIGKRNSLQRYIHHGYQSALKWGRSRSAATLENVWVWGYKLSVGAFEVTGFWLAILASRLNLFWSALARLLTEDVGENLAAVPAERGTADARGE